MMRCAASLLTSALVLSACGPISPERAARECEERARATSGVTGQVKIGGGSGGFESDFDLGVALSSDSVAGRDPQTVYTRCVEARTGHSPVRPPRL